MKNLLTITIVSYALLGNIALAGVSTVPSALAADSSPQEANMTPASPSDLALMSFALNEGGSCTKEQAAKALRTLGSRDPCPTDRCIVAFDDEAQIEGIALLSGKQTVTLSAALVQTETIEQVLSSAKNHSRVREEKNLIATITSSVIFRE